MVTAFKYLLGGKLKKADEAPTREEQLLVEKRANAEKMEFFGNISHDMRTPLNGILGFTDLALVYGLQELAAGAEGNSGGTPA